MYFNALKISIINIQLLIIYGCLIRLDKCFISKNAKVIHYIFIIDKNEFFKNFAQLFVEE